MSSMKFISVLGNFLIGCAETSHKFCPLNRNKMENLVKLEVLLMIYAGNEVVHTRTLSDIEIPANEIFMGCGMRL